MSLSITLSGPASQGVGHKRRGWLAFTRQVATLLPLWRYHGWVETTYKNVFGRKHPCPITVANKENHVASFGTLQCNELYWGALTLGAASGSKT